MNVNISSEELDKWQLIHFADPRMLQRPDDFDFTTHGDKAKDLSELLIKKMIHLGGSGLSANQIGISTRVFVFGTEQQPYTFFNPQIIGVSKEEVVMDEGCISFPDFFLALRRPAEVTIAYQDVEGTQQVVRLKGIAARIVLHEYDHMEGVNFTHHASQFKLKLMLTRYKKKQKKLLRRMKNGK